MHTLASSASSVRLVCTDTACGGLDGGVGSGVSIEYLISKGGPSSNTLSAINRAIRRLVV